MDYVEWRLYDETSDCDVSIRNRPHWDQSALTFVTFRLVDSMPKSVIERWQQDQLKWLADNGLSMLTIEDCLKRQALPPLLRRQFLKFRNQRWHSSLDDCHGSCLLREPTIARMVATSLQHFEGQRYDLERFVIMPNHVHCLVQMRAGFELRREFTGLMRYTARKINDQLSRQGELWQSETFDHIVRSERQFEYLQSYIADNPKRANLREGETLLWIRP